MKLDHGRTPVFVLWSPSLQPLLNGGDLADMFILCSHSPKSARTCTTFLPTNSDLALSVLLLLALHITPPICVCGRWRIAPHIHTLYATIHLVRLAIPHLPRTTRHGVQLTEKTTALLACMRSHQIVQHEL